VTKSPFCFHAVQSADNPHQGTNEWKRRHDGVSATIIAGTIWKI